MISSKRSPGSFSWELISQMSLRMFCRRGGRWWGRRGMSAENWSHFSVYISDKMVPNPLTVRPWVSSLSSTSRVCPDTGEWKQTGQYLHPPPSLSSLPPSYSLSLSLSLSHTSGCPAGVTKICRKLQSLRELPLHCLCQKLQERRTVI